MPYKDPAKQKENSIKYYKENKRAIASKKKKLYQKNKTKITKKQREKYKDPKIRKRKQEINRKSRIKNRDKILARNRLPKRRYRVLKRYAKERDLPCTLTEKQFAELVMQKCTYCANQLASPTNNTGVGLDRIDNNKGYDIDNVVPCCLICNRVRNDHFTPEETKIAVEAVIAFRNRKTPMQ